MASRTVTHLIDDLDGTVLGEGEGETVRFGIDGTAYEIDLTDANAAEMRAMIERYSNAGRRAASAKGGRRRRSASEVKPA